MLHPYRLVLAISAHSWCYMTKKFKLGTGKTYLAKDSTVGCFEMPDGSVFESTVKATQWQPDTCDCIIIYTNDDPHLLKIVQKCKHHKNLPTEKTMKAIQEHNKGFNLKFGRGKLTVEQDHKISDNKAKEKKRIKNLS